MAFSSIPRGIIYIDRNTLHLFFEGKGGPIVFELPKTVISDLEIINKEQLDLQIKSFIETNKIPHSQGTIILSDNIVFEKEIARVVDETQQEQEVRKFLDAIPFEHVGFRTVPTQNGVKVAAANQDLYQSVKDALEKMNFKIIHVVPATLLEKNEKDALNSLSQESIKPLLKKLDTLKNVDLLIDERQEKIKKQEQKKLPFFVQYKRILIVIFFIFSIILLAYALFTFFNVPKKSPLIKNSRVNFDETSPTPTAPQATINPQAGTTANTESSSGASDQIKIQIQKTSSTNNQANKLADQLRSVGFINVQLITSSNVNNVETIILLSSHLTSQIRAKIIQEAKNVFPNLTTQETDVSNFDVVIILGKS